MSEPRSLISHAPEEPEAEHWSYMVWHAMYREGGGGNPDSVLDTLAGMVERRKELDLETPERLRAAVLPHGDSRGIHEDDLRVILSLQHRHEREGSEVAKRRLDRVRDVIRHEVLNTELSRQGRPEKDRNPTFAVGPAERGETYLTRRLRRDNPDLYEEVRAGRLSASRAANLAGITKQRRSVRIDSPHAAVNGLLRWFTVEEIREALDAEEVAR